MALRRKKRPQPGRLRPSSKQLMPRGGRANRQLRRLFRCPNLICECLSQLGQHHPGLALRGALFSDFTCPVWLARAGRGLSLSRMRYARVRCLGQPIVKITHRRRYGAAASGSLVEPLFRLNARACRYFCDLGRNDLDVRDRPVRPIYRTR